MCFPCDACNYVAMHERHLTRHKESVHMGVRFTCDECEHSASSKYHLHRHKLAKHLGVRYPCDMCDYQAQRQHHLKRHKINKHKCLDPGSVAPVRTIPGLKVELDSEEDDDEDTYRDDDDDDDEDYLKLEPEIKFEEVDHELDQKQVEGAEIWVGQQEHHQPQNAPKLEFENLPQHQQNQQQVLPLPTPSHREDAHQQLRAQTQQQDHVIITHPLQQQQQVQQPEQQHPQERQQNQLLQQYIRLINS